MSNATMQMTHYSSLSDRHVFITGGASGIGECMVRGFCAQGAKVTFIDIAQQMGEQLAKDLKGRYPHDAHFMYCDIRDIDSLKACIDKAAELHGDIAVLINNAADDTRHTFDEMDQAYWDERFAVNLRPCFFAAQAAIPQMKRLGKGSIINMGSVSWRIKQTGMPAYTTAKAAIEGLTRSLAATHGQDGIRVNTLVPGWVMTEKQLSHWLTPELLERVRQSQCIPQTLEPEHILKAALFLAADDSEMMTAQSMVVDGGWT